MTETAIPPAPIPVRERGYAHDTSGGEFWGQLADEPTPELQWPQCIAVYDRMRKQDAQVASVLRAVTSPIIRTNWSIDGEGCDPDVTAFVAANLGLPIKGTSDNPDAATLRGRDRFSWSTHLRLALLMLPFGHSFFEQVYRPPEQDPDGYARLRKLGPRLPKTISKINVARDGGLVSIEQRELLTLTQLAATGTPIPVKRLVAYVNEREGGNWYGTSLLRSAYKFWLLKDQALRTWSISIDRNGIGSHVYIGADGESELVTGKKIATGMRSGTSSGAAIAHGAQLEIKGVDGHLPDIEKFVRYCDEQIARAVLAHFLNLGTQTGSWALGSTFADFFTLSLQAVAEEVRDTGTAHIVEDLVDINFGPTVPAPQLVFDEIGSRGQHGVDDELAALRKAAGLEDDQALAQFLQTHVTGAAA